MRGSLGPGRLLPALLAAAALLAGAAAAGFGAEIAPQDQVNRILDRSTDLHWGESAVVWITHYPEELVDPWVRAEAARRGMGPAEAEAYRRSFRTELRMDRMEPFLLSVHVSGEPAPVLAPLSDHLALIDAAGKRVRPVTYERRLDQPLRGLVQGLVFFPRQSGGFRLVLKGLASSGGETSFLFGTRTPPAPTALVGLPVPTRVPAVLVTVPPRRPSPSPKKTPPAPTKPLPTVVVPLRPVPPARPSAPEKPIPSPVPTRAGRPSPTGEAPEVSRAPTPAPPPEPSRGSEATPTPSARSGDRGGVGPSREDVLQAFLYAWSKGDAKGMYRLLSAASREKTPYGSFERRALEDPFRFSLADGYRVKWNGETAQVTVTPKLVIFRATRTKSLRMVSEGGESRVAW